MLLESKEIKSLILSLILTIFVNSLLYSQSAKKEFEIFNALLYRNTPKLEEYGLKKIYIFYEDDLNYLSNRSTNESGRKINTDGVIHSAKQANLNNSIPVCLDIESWPNGGKYLKESINKYLSVLKLFKRYNRKSKIGYFGVYPMSSPHEEYNFNSQIRETVIIPNWHKINKDTERIGRAVDIYYPEFYTRSNDHNTWKKIVIEKVRKIREINKSAKIYGFIWPQYYLSNGRYDYIESDIWYKQLETLYKYCDGAVIWSGPTGPNGKVVDFNLNMGWFKETVKFINENNIN